MSNPLVKLPFGGVAVAPTGNASDRQRIVDARAKVVVDYCKAKGWPTDPTKLSIAQIMEIREQDEWKNAGLA